MFGLSVRNNRGMTPYNPFREMEELERAFFGDPLDTASVIRTFPPSKPMSPTKVTTTCWRQICPVWRKRTFSWSCRATP